MHALNLIGHVYGRLTVIAKAPNQRGVNNSIWLCRCECGNVKTFRADVLRRPNPPGRVAGAVSCGCYKREVISKMMTTHGFSNTSEYHIWHTMKKRCECSTHPAYKNHGGRGIIVCDRWRNSFDNFYADMGQRPSKRHTLDRIDNNGPYSPENCRWATPEMQGRNKRTNRMVEIDGVSFCVADWCRLMGISNHTPYDRLYWNKRSGIQTIDEALRQLYYEWNNQHA